MLHHVGGLQVLVIDGVISTHERQRCFVMEVGALPLHLLMRFGEQCDRLPAAVAALLAARHPALGCLECALRLAVPARIEDAGPVRQRGECLDANATTPALLSYEREWLRWRIG